MNDPTSFGGVMLLDVSNYADCDCAMFCIDCSEELDEAYVGTEIAERAAEAAAEAEAAAAVEPEPDTPTVRGRGNVGP